MWRILILLALLVAPIAGQQEGLQLNDGEMHGDPPFLLESGWTPLLTGKDLSGWHAQEDTGENQWMTTTGVLWERLLGPTRLRAVPAAPGGAILNGPIGRNGKFGERSKERRRRASFLFMALEPPAK